MMGIQGIRFTAETFGYVNILNSSGDVDPNVSTKFLTIQNIIF